MMYQGGTLSGLSAKGIMARLPRGLQQGVRRRHYARKLKAATLGDEPELGCLSLLVGYGSVVFDIGANFGMFSRFLSECVGAEGQVYSFEPTADMHDVLEHNCRVLHLANVQTFRLALSDRVGEAAMSIPVRKDGTLNHYEAALGTDSDPGGGRRVDFTISTTTLDRFCEDQRIAKVDFIKCDVEGHELAVLRGARGVLAASRPTILLEVNQPLDESGHGAEVAALVNELNYGVFTYQEGKIEPWQSGEQFVNYVLKPRKNGE